MVGVCVQYFHHSTVVMKRIKFTPQYGDAIIIHSLFSCITFTL